MAVHDQRNAQIATGTRTRPRQVLPPLRPGPRIADGSLRSWHAGARMAGQLPTACKACLAATDDFSVFGRGEWRFRRRGVPSTFHKTIGYCWRIRLTGWHPHPNGTETRLLSGEAGSYRAVGAVNELATPTSPTVSGRLQAIQERRRGSVRPFTLPLLPCVAGRSTRLAVASRRIQSIQR